VKKKLFSLLHKLGLTRFAAWWNRKRVVILCYHGVTARSQRHPSDHHGLHVRAARFEAQLDYLRRYYKVISLADFLKARENTRSLPDYSVVLTFDDGYRNFLTAALPRITARDMPVSVFLITDRIRSKDPRNLKEWSESDDETFLHWDEVKELQLKGVEFGSHTCSHAKLSELATAEAERELRVSYKTIASHLSQTRMPFAFPYGSYSDAVIAMTRTLAYTCALTTDAGINSCLTDPFMLRRNLIGDDDDEPLFAARVSGLIAFLQRAAKSHKTLI